MSDLNATTLFVSFLLTWTIGLTPPLLIRYALLRRPIGSWAAIGTCAGFWLLNILIFTAMGSTSKTHGALVLVALASYWILRKRGAAQASTAIADTSAVAVTTIHELPTRQGPSQTHLDLEEPLYEMIAIEIETRAVNKALWTKAFSLANGDDQLTKAKYIQLRIKQLQESQTPINEAASAATQTNAKNVENSEGKRPANNQSDQKNSVTLPPKFVGPAKWIAAFLIAILVVVLGNGLADAIWPKHAPTKGATRGGNYFDKFDTEKPAESAVTTPSRLPDFSQFGTPVQPEGAFDKYLKTQSSLDKYLKEGSDAEKAVRFGITLQEYQRRDARAKVLCISGNIHDFDCWADVLAGQR